MAILVRRAGWRWVVFSGLAAMGLSHGGLAKEGDAFRPFVSLGHYYDSNLFRLAEAESPGTQRDERYSQLNAGVNLSWQPGRQQVSASLAKTLIRYDQNTRLDFDGDDMQATWEWRLGNRLFGNLGASKSTSQSSFNDLGVVNASNNVERKRQYGQLNWEFHPRWQVYVGTEASDTLNTLQGQVSQNVRQTAHDMGFRYLTPKGSSVRARVQRTVADYPTQQIVGVTNVLFLTLINVSDNSFQQTDYTLDADWRLFGKLNLRGQLSRTERAYDNVLRDPQGGFARLVERPDFSGFTGRLTGDWFATGKTLLSTSLYQELGATSDINASTVLKRGLSVSGVWTPRGKWRLNAGASFENRDYQGDPGAATRNDDTVAANVSLGYTPINALSLVLGGQAGWRDSSTTDDNYKFYGLSFNIRGDF